LPTQSLEELDLLLRAHHPLIALVTNEAERAEVLIEYLAAGLELPYFEWSEAVGLKRLEEPQPVYGTRRLNQCLAHIQHSRIEGIYHLKQVDSHLAEPEVVSQLAEIAKVYGQHRGAVVLTGRPLDVPDELGPLVARIELEPPTDD
jgi:hypothetical protein